MAQRHARRARRCSCSPSLTASASGRSRRPLQASHVRVTSEAPELVVADRALVVVGIVVVRRRRRRPSSLGVEPALEPRDDAVVARAPAPSCLRGLRPLAGRRGCACLRRLGQLRPRHVGVDAERLDRARDLGGERDASRGGPTRARRPRAACARGSGDDALGIDRGARAEAVARGARAVRAVEREHARLDRRQRDAAVDAREALAHPQRARCRRRGSTSRRPSPSLSASSTESVRRPFTPSLSDDAVDDDVEVVRLACDRARSRRRGRRPAPSMRARTKPSRRRRSSSSLSSPLRARAMGARTLRRAPSPQREDAVDDLLHRLRLDALAAVRAVRHADAREEEAQVVGDLGDGADGRARALGERALLDGDGRARGPRCSRRRAWRAARGTAARRRRATRRSGAGPRRRSCRTRATTCPSRSGP